MYSYQVFFFILNFPLLVRLRALIIQHCHLKNEKDWLIFDLLVNPFNSNDNWTVIIKWFSENEKIHLKERDI